MRKRDSKQLWTTILLYLPIFALSKETAFFKKTANLLKKLLPNLPGTQKINLDFEKKVAAASWVALLFDHSGQ